MSIKVLSMLTSIRTRVLAGVSIMVASVIAPAIAFAVPTITEYPVTANSSPYGIAKGPDGNMWFTLTRNQIGKSTTSGDITYYSVPTTNSVPEGIVAGPDGNMWFTEENGNKIAKITTSGVITEYALPTASSVPEGITVGSDNNLWFVERSNNKVAKITTAGVITEYSIPTASSQPYFITAGPDNNLWFTESGTSKVGKVTTSGVFTEYTAPSLSNAKGIAKGPDGGLWVAGNSNYISRISTTGVVTAYPLTNIPGTWGITAGPDGAMWFTELGSATVKIGRISINGVVTEYPIPTSDSTPYNITTGPDNNLWFVESTNGGAIAKLYPPTAAPTNVKATSPTATPVLTWTAATGATSYSVYRNGVSIGTTSNTTYTDSIAVSGGTGTYQYYVTASNAQGESVASTVIYVIIDQTTPSITVSPSIAGTTVSMATTVSGTASDNLTGIKGNQVSFNFRAQTGTTCSSTNTGPTFNAVVDGAGNWTFSTPTNYAPNGLYCVIGSVTDGAGNTATSTVKGITIAN